MKVNIGKYPKSSLKQRKIDVRVDEHDIWNLDDTLALIIVPALKRYRESIHGSPHVDNEDVPEHLQMSDEDLKNYNHDGKTDSKFHERWTWVVDQMIWSFENHEPFENNSIYDENGLFVKELYDSHVEKVQNGMRLFAKYYKGLWT